MEYFVKKKTQSNGPQSNHFSPETPNAPMSFSNLLDQNTSKDKFNPKEKFMAVKNSASAHVKRSRRKDAAPSSLILKLLKNPKSAMALALLFIDSLLVSFIIAYVPYTKIDWDAYMSQVSGFVGGERDYKNLKGDTGPLVYPAGFLYVYSAIQYITGGQVFPAQLPWWALSLICLSKRVHSIFVLRLFNDCFAMTLLHAAMTSILYQRWHLGLIIFRL